MPRSPVVLAEMLKTLLQTPQHTYSRSVIQELRQEIVTLRRLRARDALIISEQRALLRAAEPCPACVAKGEPKP